MMRMYKGMYVLLFSGAAAWRDWRSSKIPNTLLITGVIGGFFYCRHPIFAVRLILPVLALYPLYHLRMVGAGDVKLYAVYAGLLGYPEWLVMFLLSLFLAALWSVHRIWSKGIAQERAARMRQYIREAAVTGRLQPYFVKGIDPEHAVIPLAVPMFLSATALTLYSFKEVIVMWISG